MDRNTNYNNHRERKNSNGFWLGFVMGVLVTLMFTTKKGRQILKDLVDKGVEKFDGLEKSLQEAEEAFEEELKEGNDYVQPVPPQAPPEPAEAPQEPVKEVRYLAQEEAQPAQPVGQKMGEAKQEKPVPKKETNGVARKPSSVRKFFRLKKS